MDIVSWHNYWHDFVTICDIDLLPQQKVGVWRPGSIYIVDEVNGKETIQYTGPDADRLPKLIGSFLKWVQVQKKSKLHPVLLAGLIMYVNLG